MAASFTFARLFALVNPPNLDIITEKVTPEIKLPDPVRGLRIIVLKLRPDNDLKDTSHVQGCKWKGKTFVRVQLAVNNQVSVPCSDSQILLEVHDLHKYFETLTFVTAQQ